MPSKKFVISMVVAAVLPALLILVYTSANPAPVIEKEPEASHFSLFMGRPMCHPGEK